MRVSLVPGGEMGSGVQNYLRGLRLLLEAGTYTSHSSTEQKVKHRQSCLRALCSNIQGVQTRVAGRMAEQDARVDKRLAGREENGTF